MNGKERLLNEIFRPMTDEEKKNCDGHCSSLCCGAPIDQELMICGQVLDGEGVPRKSGNGCGEHSSNECSDCKEENCPNRKNF